MFFQNRLMLFPEIYFNTKRVFLGILFINMFFLAQSRRCIAQTNCLEVPIKANYQFKKLILNDTVYQLKNAHPIKFETLKFYFSGISLVKGNQAVWQEENSFHLIDFEESDSNYLCLDIPEELNFDAIQFNLGIDSLTNVSGAYGGDLDPTKGMYWTWQNGYINFKLEGTSDLCKNPKNEFQLHLGGYLQPFNNVQKVKLNVANPALFSISFDLEKFVNTLDLELLNHVMSPNAAAVELAQMAAKCFLIK